MESRNTILGDWIDSLGIISPNKKIAKISKILKSYRGGLNYSQKMIRISLLYVKCMSSGEASDICSLILNQEYSVLTEQMYNIVAMKLIEINPDFMEDIPFI